MKNFITQLDIRNNNKEVKKAIMAAVLLVGVSYGVFAFGQAVTLTVTVQQSLSFITQSSGFATSTGTITPGTPLYATTTLLTTTNDSNGWNVSLGGTNAGGTGVYNLQGAGSSIPDQTQWVPGGSTSTPGNATTTANFVNSANVLAFRVMSASSTNGASFLSTSWWGANDAANAMWAGIASSSPARQIGNAGSGSYSAATHYNTVQYYLAVAITQPTGTYTAPITYTATGQP
jgi:hypothetical protein